MAQLPDSTNQALERLNRIYFCDTGHIHEAAAGEYIVAQGEECHRLFLILEGSVVAMRRAETFEGCDLPAETNARAHEVFRAGPGSYICVQAFFSRTYHSSNDIIALEDTKLAYIDDTTEAIDPDTHGPFEHQFLPVLIHELAERNRRMFDRAAEKEEAIRVIQRHEMAVTLGQLSAGIAHELNNAVGVITRRTDFVADNISTYLQESSKENSHIFRLGYDSDTYIDQATLRKRARKYEYELNMPQVAAKILAHIAPDNESFRKLGPDMVRHIKQNYRFWELGHDLHDMQIAARHATGIVRAVKLLGGGNSTRQPGVDVVQSVHDAMNLLSNKLKHLTIHTDLQPVPEIHADISELVQIWANILQNAHDAMTQAGTEQPTINVSTNLIHADGLKLLPEDYIRVTISNNGPAIPDDIQEKIFQPNFTTKKKGLDFGLGLGLSIVRRLVDSYNGTIDLSSTRDLTTFTIYIPTTQIHGNN